MRIFVSLMLLVGLTDPAFSQTAKEAIASCDIGAFVKIQESEYARIDQQTLEIMSNMKIAVTKRSELSARKVEVLEMGKLERDVKGVFDKDYDIENIESRIDALNNQISLFSQNLSFIKMERSLLGSNIEQYQRKCLSGAT